MTDFDGEIVRLKKLYNRHVLLSRLTFGFMFFIVHNLLRLSFGAELELPIISIMLYAWVATHFWTAKLVPVLTRVVWMLIIFALLEGVSSSISWVF